MIRKATLDDIPSIQETIKPYADSGDMLPRTLNDLYEHIRDFYVYEKDGSIFGIVALSVSWEGIAEIRSLAIQKNSLSSGIGTALVKHCLKEAGTLHVKKIFALTYTAKFFEKMGFHHIDKEDLPQKIWKDCVNCSKFPVCDEQALIIEV